MAFAGGPIGIGKVCPAATSGGNEACPEEAAVDFAVGGGGFASPGACLYGMLLDMLRRPGVLNPQCRSGSPVTRTLFNAAGVLTRTLRLRSLFLFPCCIHVRAHVGIRQVLG